ncbi:putative neutrophil cytosol factor 1C [Etheostoma cragini]|uniref:putative neutrophil cytosol factor 1C n=1 Tax=Etheostoma cragini TaxID=417921 RepID=UPI00155DE35E|nr:putative neutrophil cytosol factor 1C [Etheostoma cragini]
MAGEQRFVFSARIIGAVHRDTPKLKMFMISVLWSDETEVIVYRSFQDFKNLHRQLKKRFPPMNPFRRKDRVIPKFKEYLISSPGWWLVENEDKVLAWFPAPYLELWDGEDGDNAEFQLAGALYCAVRSYSTTKNDEVSVPIGAVVEVLRKSDNGWWLIRFNGKAGYIPSMNLQPYNNPRSGLYSLQRKLHSSALNLATSTEPQASHAPCVSEEIRGSAGQSRAESSVLGRLHKARSLDVLSETRLQTQMERNVSTSDRLARSNSSSSNRSTETSFSSFSSSRKCSLISAASPQSSGSSFPDLSLSDRRSSNTSSESYGSVSSKGRETALNAPMVPPRPKTEEILNRCTTMTRKAALATKTQLQIQPESIHSR